MKQNREPIGFQWAYRDWLWSMVVTFIALAVISLLAKTQENKGITPGALIIESHWDDSSKADIDLWVQSPRDKPIGYSRLSGVSCNLVRDDVGRPNDPVSTNSEIVICREAWAGTYIVNVMAYNAYDGHFPVNVTIRITRLGNATSILLTKMVALTHMGQELTVVRFTLDNLGNIIPDSINNLQIPLREAK